MSTNDTLVTFGSSATHSRATPGQVVTAVALTALTPPAALAALSAPALSAAVAAGALSVGLVMHARR